ncbi:isocitrate/isopropylmalate family dehydrogenase [Arthrobacter sp. I2-34]|uniref:Isocitrate/isopropylmalate family dehydrogenase n=1 Tax=Arthrobacter hankyongi TaxID=2904801 RepID=A0ABS9L9C1_9MICC|nr:isocitrate/isopropylmalate family dehydrogenase [Arthrobacter hankyongi]MCG2623281.1 isocitrate/isopropylmalate family dehydrogenase [Arthrobacter hankyongi]
MREYHLGLIPGDGIGPELTAAAAAVLETAARGRFVLRWHREDGGAGTYRRTGTALSAAALERIRGYDATLKGPVGLPEVRTPDGLEAGVLGGILRTGLDAYANLRPVRSLLPGGRRIDYVIVRENTEGLYASRGNGVGNDHAMVDQLLVTRAGTERIVRRAFAAAAARRGAPADGVRRVTCVDKANVLRSYAFFRRIFDEVAEEFPQVEAEHRYADAAAYELVAAPGRFDVIVTENFIGDILSDVGAATVGGLGMCPAANVGDGAAYFEPAHGSAPALAGRDRANPAGQLLCAAMLLDHLGEAGAAADLRGAVTAAFDGGGVQLAGDGTPAGGLAGTVSAVVAALASPTPETNVPSGAHPPKGP